MNTGSTSFYPSLQTIEIEDQNEAGRDTAAWVKSDQEPSFFVEDRPTGSVNKTETVEVPYVFSEFNGFSDGLYTPPDDYIAVSAAGYVVSVTNSIYRIFAPNSSTQLKSYDFGSALKSTFPNITGTYYDPRVIYDPESDRFVIVVFNGISSTTSNIVVLFSKTNNPTDGWNGYSFSGDMFSKSEWSDYPNIGISKSDLFITSNLFDDNSSPDYIEPGLLQIDKSSGYSGSSLKSRTWETVSNFSIQPTLFTLVPASQGLGSDYGDTMYFVSNVFGGGKQVNLLTLIGNEASSGATLTQKAITYKITSNFSSPNSAGSSQKSTTQTLNMGDSRVKQAFYLNNTIHYAFSSRDASTGYSDIVYCRLNVPGGSVTIKELGLTGYDYVYPSLASLATNNQNQSVLIGYCKSGTSMYPEVDAVQCDSSGAFSSSIVIFPGQSAVTGGNTSQQRWGDYTGMERQYGTNVCYFAGSYGYGAAFQTEIAQLGLKSNVGVAPVPMPVASDVKVYPDPVVNIFSVDFSLQQKSHVRISVFDMQGKEVQLLFDGVVLQGNQKFSFNKAALQQGVYSLRITNDTGEIVTKKIVVE